MSQLKDQNRANFESLLAQNRIQEAESYLHELLRRNPTVAWIVFELGNFCQQRGDHLGAIDFYQRAVECDAADVQPRLRLSGSFEQMGLFEAAAAQLEKALELETSDPKIYHALGVSYQQSGNLAGAKVAYENAISLKSDLFDSHNNLGTLLAAQGEKELAVRHFDIAIKLNPRLHNAVYNRAVIKTHRRVDRELQRIESRFNARSTDDAARASLGFALGKAYDDIGNYTKAAHFFEIANKSQRSIQPYDITQDIANFEKTMEVFRSNPLAPHSESAHAGFTPIFIVGMPRSGSSLLEHVLASHSLIGGAGELEFLDQSIRQVTPYLLSDVPKLAKSQLDEIAKTYLAQVSALPPGDVQYVVDKMPRNSEYLGVIKAAMPNSKVLYTVRDPIATCLSCYQQKFVSPKMGFSNDLGDLGNYYLAHRELMTMWEEVFPGWIIKVNYEELVTDLEPTIRGVLDAIGVDFQVACLQHHKNMEHSVSTASIMQVREPVHRRSIEKWKNYRQLLAPLQKQLEL